MHPLQRLNDICNANVYTTSYKILTRGSIYFNFVHFSEENETKTCKSEQYSS